MLHGSAANIIKLFWEARLRHHDNYNYHEHETALHSIVQESLDGLCASRMDQRDNDNRPAKAAMEQAKVQDENAVGEDSNLVVGFSIDGPSPNPARDRSSLQVNIASEGEIEIAVFDILGRQVALTDAHYGSGRHTIPLSVSSLPAGTYIVRVTSNGNRSATRQITVVR